MTEQMTGNAPVAYESPKCDITEIYSEGMLCSSIEQLQELDYYYEW